MVSMTIRDVPSEVRDELAARAARSGRSLQEYLMALLVEHSARPSVDDVVTRARRRVEATGTTVGAEVVLDALHCDRR